MKRTKDHEAEFGSEALRERFAETMWPRKCNK